jgi:hypothetical protein
MCAYLPVYQHNHEDLCSIFAYVEGHFSDSNFRKYEFKYSALLHETFARVILKFHLSALKIKHVGMKEDCIGF